ncbi:hypothetical protein pb186bvf_004836 [Paramecium bursaria]
MQFIQGQYLEEIQQTIGQMEAKCFERTNTENLYLVCMQQNEKQVQGIQAEFFYKLRFYELTFNRCNQTNGKDCQDKLQYTKATKLNVIIYFFIQFCFLQKPKKLYMTEFQQFKRSLLMNIEIVEQQLRRTYFQNQEQCFQKNKNNENKYIECMDDLDKKYKQSTQKYDVLSIVWIESTQTCFENQDHEKCKTQIRTKIANFLQQSIDLLTV